MAPPDIFIDAPPATRFAGGALLCAAGLTSSLAGPHAAERLCSGWEASYPYGLRFVARPCRVFRQRILGAGQRVRFEQVQIRQVRVIRSRLPNAT